MTQSGTARSPVIWITLFLAALGAAFIVAIISKPAEAATARSIEAERMKGAGKVYGNRSASNNRAKVIYRNRATYKWVKGSIRSIAVRARGDRCGKPPRMKVTVDGKRVMVRWIRNQKRWGYQVKRLRTSYGPHKIKVKFTNNHRTRRCDRNLRVDKLHVRLVKRQPKPLALGAMIDGAPWNASKIDDFTKLVGTSPEIVMWYQNWEQDNSKVFDPKKMNAVTSRGAMPMLTWVPKDPTRGVDQPKYALRTIIEGDHDAYIRQWAKDAKAWGKPFYLRPMHEMNGSWSPWHVGVNGNTSAEYRAAWKRIYNIFEKEGATNVRWVWSPNIAYSNSTPFGHVYPGDAYVDWVAPDGYNWGTAKEGHKWRSMAEVFGPTYKSLTRMTNKPMMIAETSSVEAGGDKAAWIKQGFLRDLPYKYPRIRAVVWFHKKKDHDYRVNTSRKALDAYKRVAGTSLYQASLR